MLACVQHMVILGEIKQTKPSPRLPDIGDNEAVVRNNPLLFHIYFGRPKYIRSTIEPKEFPCVGLKTNDILYRLRSRLGIFLRLQIPQGL